MGSRSVSIVGATGLVGSEIARILVSRRFPLRELRLFASGRREEREVVVSGHRLPVRPFTLEGVRGTEICFLAAGGDFSRRFARRIAGLGPVVIDNSSAFRRDPLVPLVVPEVNPAAVAVHRGLIANPNCSTIQLVLALHPLDRCWRLESAVVATYQSVSGQGLAATAELAEGTDAVLQGGGARNSVFPAPAAFNLIPSIGDFDSAGWGAEELKLRNETRRIMGREDLRLTATAVRVPVFRGHSEAVWARFEKPVDAIRARSILGGSPGVEVMDDPRQGVYPTPLDCAGRDAVLVGRVRPDPDSPQALSMWVVGDNVRKGAALNAVQIAETV
jgi:aspartate-semialdehyde dehydrogenase